MQYRRGADFERQVKKDLEANGWACTKSGGSRSVVDIMCVKTLLVQCKKDGYLPLEERDELLARSVHPSVHAVLAYKKNHELEYKAITEEE